MKTKFAALSALALLCAAAAKAATVSESTNLLEETFSQMTGKWSGNTGFRDSDHAWTTDGSVSSGFGGSKLGTANNVGSISSEWITPAVPENPDAEVSFTLYVQAAGYNGKSGKLAASVIDSNGDVQSWTNDLTAANSSGYEDLSDMASVGLFDFEFPFVVSNDFQIVLTTGGGDKRVLVGEVRVTEVWEYETSQIQLADPTGIVFQPSVTAVQAGWTPVEDAVGYEWEIRNASGELVHSGSGLQDTTYPTIWTSVYGLREDTAYVFRLRATGDGTDILDSGWSEESFRTQQDPWAVLWTIGEFSSQPRVGSEFSFAVSTIRRNGTAVTSVLDRVSPPVASTPSYAIENGLCVFTWTPGPDEDGDYVAHFAVRDPYGNTTDTKEVPITVRPAMEENVLFFETFSKCTGNWGASSPAAFSSSYSDSNYVWSVTSAKRGYSGMRLGNKSTYDAAVTPTIHPANDAACTVSLSFVAAGWDIGNQLTVSVPEASWFRTVVLTNGVGTAGTTPLPTGDEYSFGPYEISVPGPFTVSFQRAVGDGRMGIDSVRVVQTVSTLMTDLVVPTGLAVVDGTLSTNSFSVAWDPVANATGYDVQLRESGETDWTAAPSVLTTNATFSGLADDVEYNVQVRATGDTSLYNYSDWTNLTVRTLRSALHPTLTVGAWQNACEAGKVYGVIANTAAVSATLDDGTTPVAVSLAAVAPEPSSAPVLADGTLFWTPAVEDEGTTFTLYFEMTPAPGVAYTNTASFKVNDLPALQAPTVTVDLSSVTNAGGFASGRAGLSWDSQFRATDYAVRAWSGSPNLNATATRVEENFTDFRPAGWIFRCSSTSYADAGAPVKLEATGHWFGTYDLGGVVTNVSFRAGGHSAGGDSTLRVYGVGALSDEDFGDKDHWGDPLAEIAVADFGNTDRNFSIPVAASLGVRRIAWQYTKDGGNVGVGSVVIGGEGFSTAKFLPGWGPSPVSQGLSTSCTVSPTRPGRKNWAEVSVTDGTKTLSKVVEIDVPDANPATLLIFR